MAVTFIYKITSTGNLSLDYSGENKIGIIQEENNVEIKYQDKRGNYYVLKQSYLDKMKPYITIEETGEIQFKTISSAINCSVKNAYEEWKLVRKMKNPAKGNTGVLQYCIVQNFGTDVDPKLANVIGMEFAREYLNDYQVVVSTHINTGCVHNHIEFNATSFVTGKKFYDQLKTIDEIRKVSDAICEKYELEVLEQTRDFRYIKYKDDIGRTKFFEPTDRKRELKEGYYSDRNDYRNQNQYKSTSRRNESHIESLKADIENAMLKVKTYEELLNDLRKKGYVVQDKTSKGEWRKHITFRHSSWGKGVRDSALGEIYERENLTRRILHKQRQQYAYSRIDIEKLNLNYRTIADNGKKIKRSKVEQDVIRDIKAKSVQVENMKLTSFKTGNKPIRDSQNAVRRKCLIEQIRQNLSALFFVEEKNIKSFAQMENEWKVLEEKRILCGKQINLIENVLSKAENQILQLPEKEYTEKLRQKEKYVSQCEYLKSELDRISYEIDRYKECYETLRTLYIRESEEEFSNPLKIRTVSKESEKERE